MAATARSRTVLKDLDLTVGAGEFLCILGASGCGKSTLLNVLAGLDKVYEGRVSVSGGRVGYLFQEPRLLPWLTADGNLDFALANCRVPTSRWSELKSRYLAMTGCRPIAITIPTRSREAWPSALPLCGPCAWSPASS